MNARHRAHAWMLPAVLACGGCAHDVLITPDMGRLPSAATPSRHGVNVAYFIDPIDRARIVNSPGGGGDKVAYAPYKDLEAPLYRVLSNSFERVYALPTAGDTRFLHDHDVRYVFTPHFETTSSSDSLMTWPPTEFTLTIDVAATDAAASPVWTTRANGSGHATFAEFRNDFGLAAKRAAEQAFRQLDAQLAGFPRE